VIRLMNKLSLAAPALVLAVATAAQAQLSACTSDGVPQPTALLERFINADCERCWSDAQTPDASAGALAIDWVAPGRRGGDAPLSAVATRDAEDRLTTLGKPAPQSADSHFTRRTGRGTPKLRVVHGPAVNDYIGASIEMPAGGGPWRASLLMVETLPAGTEGSPVVRNLVRNALVVDWPAQSRTPRYELRSMQIPAGAKVDRLRVIGWLEDARGGVHAIAQSRCTHGN